MYIAELLRTPSALSAPPLLALLAVLAAACGEPDAAPVRVDADLLALYPSAQLYQESAAFDLGTEAGRRVLREGWSAKDEGTPGETTYVWAVGRESKLAFFALGSHDLQLELRGQPLTFPGAASQTLRVEVNGTELGEASLPESGGALRFAVPARVLKAGENELLLRAAFAAMPSAVLGTEDRRNLSVAWDSILIRGPASRDNEGVTVDEEHLVLPYGARVDYFLWLPPGAALVADDLRGDSDAVLDVQVARDHQPLFAATLRSTDRAWRLALGGEAGVVRLSLAAVAKSTRSDGAKTLRLERPRIEVAASPVTLAEAQPQARPNVVIYMVDTLRADRLGCYGSEQALTAKIDRFAQDAIVFEGAVAQSPWTRPSVASIFTGQRPDTHGVQGRRHRLADKTVTLAEVLQGEGYETIGFVNNPNAAGRFGLGQGFDKYRLMGRGPARNLNLRVESWLAEREAPERPFFLYLHTVEPHAPYAPPEELQQQFAPQVLDPELQTLRVFKRLTDGEIPPSADLAARLLALYEAEIADSDQHFGDFLEILESRHLASNTVVVLVSDHGEEFHEHDQWQHGHSLYTEVLDVPLIIRFPLRGSWPELGRGTRRQQSVQHVDLLPTLLAYLEVTAPAGLDGRNLLPFLRQSKATADSERWKVFSTIRVNGRRGRSVTTRRHRFILPESRNMGPAAELYDRFADPDEQENIAADWPILSEYFRIQLTSLKTPEELIPAVLEEELEPEIREQLKALGYLE